MSTLLELFNRHIAKGADFRRAEFVTEVICDEVAIDELNERTDFLGELDFSNIAMQCRCITYIHATDFPINKVNRGLAHEAIGRHFLMVMEKAASQYVDTLIAAHDAATTGEDCMGKYTLNIYNNGKRITAFPHDTIESALSAGQSYLNNSADEFEVMNARQHVVAYAMNDDAADSKDFINGRA